MKFFVLFITYVMIYVPVPVLSSIYPFISRKTVSFGINIPEEMYHSPEIKRIRTSYKNKSLLSGGAVALLAGLLLILNQSEWVYLFLSFGLFIQLGMIGLFYLQGYKEMKAIKAEKNWSVGKAQVVVIETGFRGKKMMVSPWWFILHIVIFAASVVMMLMLYDKIPDRIPMHFNIHGDVDRWADKSYKAIMWAPLAEIFITVIFAFSYWMISKSKQQVDPAHPEKSIEQNRAFRYRWSAFLVFSGLAIELMFAAIMFSTSGLFNNLWFTMIIPFVVCIGMIVAAVILSVTTGQGGSRVVVKEEAAGEAKVKKVMSREEDKYWKLGVYYYNPEDPSCFVEKRFGVGWTMNFARPLSWVIMIGIFVLIIGFTWGSIWLTK